MGPPDARASGVAIMPRAALCERTAGSLCRATTGNEIYANRAPHAPHRPPHRRSVATPQ